MKKIIVFILVSFLYSCQNPKDSNSKEDKSLTSNESFDWLLGKWQRINETEGKETFESWKKLSNSEYSGFGFTIQNKDTIWQESIKLVNSYNGWSFEVMGKGENAVTSFKLNQIEKERFSCINFKNEFPTQIQYLKNSNNIKAIISGGGKEIPFEFKRIE